MSKKAGLLAAALAMILVPKEGAATDRMYRGTDFREFYACPSDVDAGGHRYPTSACTTSSPKYFTHALDIPNGAVLNEVVFYYLDSDDTLDISFWLYRVEPEAATWHLITYAVGSATSTLVQARTLSFAPVPIDTSRYVYYVGVSFGVTGGAQRIVGAKVRYSGTAGTAFPMPSADRYMDSRPGGQNRGGRALPFTVGSGTPGVTWDFHDLTVTGVSGRDDRIIPVGTVSVTGNVTAVSPTGDGLFKILPGGTNCSTGTSTVNFKNGFTTANAFNSALDGDGRLRVCFTGTGQVDVLVDISMYYR